MLPAGVSCPSRKTTAYYLNLCHSRGRMEMCQNVSHLQGKLSVPVAEIPFPGTWLPVQCQCLNLQFCLKSHSYSTKLPMMHGPAGTENDMPFIENLYISGAERRALENLQKGRSRTSVSKCLPRTYIEEMLERMLQVNGEQGLNKFRDSARIVSESLGMTAEFETLPR